MNLLDEKRLSALWYAARPSHINSSRSTVAALMAAGADPHLGRSPLTDCRIGKTMKAYVYHSIILIIFCRKSINQSSWKNADINEVINNGY